MRPNAGIGSVPQPNGSGMVTITGHMARDRSRPARALLRSTPLRRHDPVEARKPPCPPRPTQHRRLQFGQALREPGREGLVDLIQARGRRRPARDPAEPGDHLRERRGEDRHRGEHPRRRRLRLPVPRRSAVRQVGQRQPDGARDRHQRRLPVGPRLHHGGHPAVPVLAPGAQEGARADHGAPRREPARDRRAPTASSRSTSTPRRSRGSSSARSSRTCTRRRRSSRSSRQHISMKNLCIVAPDTGGADMARYYSNQFQCALAVVDKARDYSKTSVVESMRLVGDVEGKRILMPDDLIATGRHADQRLPPAQGARGRRDLPRLLAAVLQRERPGEARQGARGGALRAPDRHRCRHPRRRLRQGPPLVPRGQRGRPLRPRPLQHQPQAVRQRPVEVTERSALAGPYVDYSE